VVNVVFNATTAGQCDVQRVQPQRRPGHWNFKTQRSRGHGVAYLLTLAAGGLGAHPSCRRRFSRLRRAGRAGGCFPFCCLPSSACRTIGLHWVLGFVPLFIGRRSIWMPHALRRSLAFRSLVLAAPHLLLLVRRLPGRRCRGGNTPGCTTDGVPARDTDAGGRLAARHARRHHTDGAHLQPARHAVHHKRYVPVRRGRHHACLQDDTQRTSAA
jgi:hypothetical protein